MKIVTSFGPSRIGQQQHCLSTWQKYGLPIVAVQTPAEIDEVRKHFSGVEFVVDHRGGDAFGRPNNVRIRVLADQAEDEPILLVNSDISIKDSVSQFYRDWIDVEPEVFKVGVRWDRKSREEKSLNPNGIDAFRVTPAQQRDLPDRGFAIGCPVWDWWIAWEMLVAGYRLKAKTDHGLIHQVHPFAWTSECWDTGWRLFARHHRVDLTELTRIIRVATGRTDVKAKKRFVPTDAQKRHQQNKLVIATTPQSGSNLLLYSLAQHPAAINAGEMYCGNNSQDVKSRVASCEDFITECNLFKLFALHEGNHDFERILSAGKVVYLYREDTEAQVASWNRAAETGIWSHGQGKPKAIGNIPEDPRRVIERGKEIFLPRADLIVCYEDLVADWDGQIRRILDLAGWGQMNLEQAMRKQAVAA